MNVNYAELLIGCGAKRVKDLRLPTADELRGAVTGSTGKRVGTEFQKLFTLDNNPDHKPDVVHDLNRIPFCYRELLPWPELPTNILTSAEQESARLRTEARRRDVQAWNRDSVMSSDYFDEIHAYEVLEHVGAQGDYRSFFALFSELWRILKPGGYLFATCPSWHSPWAWGDPSHTRVLTAGSLVFLSQAEYARQVGKTAMSDFRSIYKADFRAIIADDSSDSLLMVLQAIKREGDVCDGCGLTRAQCEAGRTRGAIKCCPDCDHYKR